MMTRNQWRKMDAIINHKKEKRISNMFDARAQRIEHLIAQRNRLRALILSDLRNDACDPDHMTIHEIETNFVTTDQLHDGDMTDY